MDQHIFIKFSDDSLPVPGEKSRVQPQVQCHERHAYLFLQTPDRRVWFSIFGLSSEIVEFLEASAAKIRAETWANSQREAMPVEPAERYFSLVELTDIANVPNPTERLRLLLERFRHSPADIYDALLDDYKKLTGKSYKPEVDDNQPDSDVLADVEKLRPRLKKLMKGGRVVKTRVAEALGLPNGGSSYSYVQAVAEALEKEAA